MKHEIQGVMCAAATPVTQDGEPALAAFVEHARRLLDEGCHAIALLGTTGEANSFGIGQRKAILEAALKGGITGEQLLPGTSALSVADTVDLTRHAVEAGSKGVLVLPPHYYKNVSDEGLYRYFSRVIDGVGDDRTRLVLYHIPPISMTPISHDLIERLMAAYPGIVCGIKDSSGDVENMKAMAARFPDLGVLTGADPHMLPLLQGGGAGCITACCNLGASALRRIWDGWQDPAKAADVSAAQDHINLWRSLSNKYPQLATIKTMLARKYDNQAWRALLPPLVELTDAQCRDIWSEMEKLGA